MAQTPCPVCSKLPLSLEAYEKACIERALVETKGDVIAAAKALGIGKSTLYRKLRQHGVPVPSKG
jgi:transcriptional regulator of acetoin/glycerol metabolism